MQFSALPPQAAIGGILAHSLMLDGRRIAKGTVIDAALAAALEQDYPQITVALPAPDDLGEDLAATRLAAAMADPSLSIAPAHTGRVNIFAEQAGLVRLNADAINAFNRIDEAVTLATVPDRAAVAAGTMVATLKIIPYAVPGRIVEQAGQAAAGIGLRVQPFAARRAVLIQTVLPGTSARMLDKTARVTADRLAGLGATLIAERRCAHEGEALTAEIGKAPAADWLLIAGASAIADRRDVIPAALTLAGGTISHFGMPVDPGNLILTGRLGRQIVIGLPGCARSPRLNGLDWILQRLAAGEEVGPAEIMGMGVGGLLVDTPARPLPRAAASARRTDIHLLLLAAGQSRRMGGPNKLLMEIDGEAMAVRSLRRLLDGFEGPVTVVLGRDGAAVQASLAKAFEGRLGPGRLSFVTNPAPERGLGRSIATGIKALPDSAGAALIALADMPETPAGIARTLIQPFNPVEGRAIIAPVHDGRRGHPVLFDHRFFAALGALDADQGARELLAEHGDQLHELAIGDPGILLDLDTPDAFSAYSSSGA